LICDKASSPSFHSLTAIHKAEHVILSNELLYQFRSIEYHGWQSIIIFDESWFWLSTGYERI
jgi:hypothetical protein